MLSRCLPFIHTCESCLDAVKAGTRWTTVMQLLNPTLQALLGKNEKSDLLVYFVLKKKKKKSGKTLKTTDVAALGFCPREHVSMDVTSGWPIVLLPSVGLRTWVSAGRYWGASRSVCCWLPGSLLSAHTQLPVFSSSWPGLCQHVICITDNVTCGNEWLLLKSVRMYRA